MTTSDASQAPAQPPESGSRPNGNPQRRGRRPSGHNATKGKARAARPAAIAEETVADLATDRALEQRDRRGRFVAGNSAAVKHGARLRRARLPGVLEALRRESAAFLEQSIADDGGRAELSRRRLSQHENRAALQLLIWNFNAALHAHGLTDRHGNVRLAWIQRIESLVGKALEIDRVLGLDRRARRVEDLHEYLTRPEDAPAEARGNQGLTDPAPATPRED